ncbi:glycoside hydrolase family 26 protein [Arcticibacter eurypsychrophilus]|uniref:glycoside hydrolase family 26 protein n=1 Tax=Arcticibacter eurypsychrophilus TaxID=1434752 RepID=UPI00084D92B1|nr:glycosyl hydrolase [Arcticibacter eurypsychrophilus]
MKCKNLFIAALAMVSLHVIAQDNESMRGLTDQKANLETQALFKNLKAISRHQILFGHQSATEYGHGWYGDKNRSDVKSVTGSHPAVIGVDFSSLWGKSTESISKSKAFLKKSIRDTYRRGGVTTVAWHFNNPVTPETGFYWKDSVSAPAVPDIIPGGSHHEQYKKILKTLAEVAKSAKGKDGQAVPMIFRPYHEFDGDWFWWGKPYCKKEEFISLWRFTVTYLRDSLDVHNFIYAFSPDVRFTTEEEYLDRYPGDAYVDLVGMDDYADFGREGKYDLDAAVKRLRIVSDYAKKTGKLAAFTETGLETIPNPVWWTDVLLKTLKSANLELCYVLVWRNDSKSATHFYAPYPGQQSVPDFIKFYKDPFILFEKDLKHIYKN